MVLSAQKTVEVSKLQFIDMPVVFTTGAHGRDRAETRADSTVRFFGKVEDVLVVVSTTRVDGPDSAENRLGSVVHIPIKIDRRHPCRGAEADPYRPDCSDGDRNSTVAESLRQRGVTEGMRSVW